MYTHTYMHICEHLKYHACVRVTRDEVDPIKLVFERLAEYCWNSTVWSLEFDETVPLRVSRIYQYIEAVIDFVDPRKTRWGFQPYSANLSVLEEKSAEIQILTLWTGRIVGGLSCGGILFFKVLQFDSLLKFRWNYVEFRQNSGQACQQTGSPQKP